nr:hypothetical protein [Mycoplasmopsis bovis]
MEKESDIWGVGLEDRDLWKALSNKNRRFLQDFAGMLEAVKNRREQNGLKGADEKWLSPFDMWVVNAIDYYSGTLNPTVNSTLKQCLPKLNIWLRMIRVNMSSKKLVFQC